MSHLMANKINSRGQQRATGVSQFPLATTTKKSNSGKCARRGLLLIVAEINVLVLIISASLLLLRPVGGADLIRASLQKGRHKIQRTVDRMRSGVPGFSRTSKSSVFDNYQPAFADGFGASSPVYYHYYHHHHHHQSTVPAQQQQQQYQQYAQPQSQAHYQSRSIAISPPDGYPTDDTSNEDGAGYANYYGHGPMVQSAGQTMDSDDYNSKCTNLNRPFPLQSAPTLHFFSTKKHGRATYRCSEELSLDLKPVNIRASHQMKLDLDERGVRTDLIDSGLYDPKLVTYFIIHGFQANWRSNPWLCDVKDLILNSSRANVFIVDWGGGAKPLVPVDYGQSVSATKLVAQLVSQFIESLLSLSGQQDGSRLHLIGHSLGAHIAGYIGYSVRDVGRITGLDPAGPCYRTHPTADGRITHQSASRNGHIGHGERRLSPQSARAVLALHTDTALFGLNENCGHYDVYVNGGYRQPDCGSIDFVSRLNDLFDLNPKQFLNPKLVCAHSFSHDLMDTFAQILRGLLHGQQHESAPVEELGGWQHSRSVSSSQYKHEVRPDLNDAERCYPMAYNCDSWQAYIMGECGLCKDNSPNCIYVSLASALAGLPPIDAELSPYSQLDPDAPRLRDKSRDDDNKFNDEDDRISGPLNPTRPTEKRSYGRHFMKSGPSKPITCLYQYQVIVATRRGPAHQRHKPYFYLHLPLEESGTLTDRNGRRQHGRLVQVSHKLEPADKPYQRVREHYARDILRTNRLRLDLNDGLELYTALITFAIAPAEQCRNKASDGDTRSSNWQLCRPLSNLREAQLWSQSEAEVGAVQWVALNYMSGLDFETRTDFSYVLMRNNNKVLTRNQVDDGSTAKLHEMAPSHGNFIGDAAFRGAKCFINVFNINSAATQFQCTRSSTMLSYAIEMTPIRLRA